MSTITITEIANKIQEAMTLAKTTGCIQYLFTRNGSRLEISERYDQSYTGRIYPGGRVELRGPVGDQVKKYLEGKR